MALRSGEDVLWVSLLNTLPYYILENNARNVTLQRLVSLDKNLELKE